MATLDSVRGAVGAVLGAAPGVIHRQGRLWAIVTFPSHPQAETVIPALAMALSNRPDLLYAEPDFEGSGHLVPTDDEFTNQKPWTDAVGMESAWDITQGSSEVRLAVLDSGISITPGTAAPDHVELSGARFIVGHDYVDGDDIPGDEHGHGTHVTGIIAAKANNTDGIAGINWTSEVYVARVIDDLNRTYASWIKAAMDDLVQYAEDHGWGRVIVNLSLGVPNEADSMKQMCADTGTGVFLLCCGVGALDATGTALDYPGAFAADFDHVIAVAAVDGDKIKDPNLESYEPITIFAPGIDIVSVAPTYQCFLSDPADTSFDEYPRLSGSSQAAAIVSGTASLMWSANLDLTPAQLRHCLLHTAESFTDGTHEGLRVHAGNAVRAADWTLSLDTVHLTFVDVAEGETRAQKLAFTVESCTDLTFEVMSGSDTGLPASLLIVQRVARYDPDVDGSALEGIEVTYTGGAAGAVAFGEFKVHCVESGDEWTVYLTANTIAPVRTAIVLVADKSGSMAQASGVSGLSRMEVLQYSAGILVDTMRVGDALGVVSFDADAYAVAALTDITGEATTSGERVGLKNNIAALAPGSSTSIGDGVVLGDSTVSGAAQTQRALLVLTDGHENTAEYIADVMGSITVPVYAIGMGTAAVIQPASLSALTTSSGGYVVLTDTMDDSTRYKVAKYLIQMLAAVSGTSLVLDPAGYLRPRIKIEIPFDICREDREFTAIFMMEGSSRATFELTTPAGKPIDAATPLDGVDYVPGQHASCFRVRLPIGARRGGEQEGRWYAVLSITDENFERVLHGLTGGNRPGPRGLPYQFMVRAESSLSMTGRVETHGHSPGSTIDVSAVLASRSLALDGAAVGVRVRRPDGVETDIQLKSIGRGAYEAGFVATLEGVYECRIRARGHSSRGDVFTREETRTAHIWSEGAVTSMDRMRAHEMDASTE